ncbi:glutamyl-tRNA reductase [Novipirellula artificiosorum]|uniref:Glutamyl-tRNA reductase n=1 Tax=Novipirellula artificiosorum TaxID=2528016 RepID=A0A5C6DKJ2_9BACT|nr:glutamyl-tRNA reductase [Novipirellula artificiosorum]TWU37380.1 Glutamyl-tRNA reductase [Novipirellula artificiosorum]
MNLQMIGCSHQDAAVEFRERISFSGDQLVQALDDFRDRFPAAEIVLLSTCNRLELYASSNDESSGLDRDAVATFLAEQRHLSPDEVIDRMIYRIGPEAVEHLFTVAASLDSMVLGEAQILSQVKQAYDLACTSGSVGPLTHAVFQAANRTAKRVQQETSIHRRRVSVPSVAVGEVVPEVFDSLSDKHVLICGAGEMSEETLPYLKQAGATQITIINRSAERADALAARFDVATAPWTSLNEKLIEADLLIGTTSAADPIIDAARFASIEGKRYGRVLLVLDLAVPRDFDPKLGTFSNVYLYQIDDLKAACERNRREREKEYPKAQQIIAEETEKLILAINHRSTGPVIQRLRNHAEEIKREELRRLQNKLQQLNVDDAVLNEIDKSFGRLTNKLLHPPLASVRDDAAEGHQRGLVEALRHLFKLGD